MPTLLHIDSSPLGEASISRHLTHEFIENWKKANPNGKVITRDLASTTIPPIDAAWIGANFTPQDSRPPAQKELLTLSDTLTSELREADEYVFGVSMHNFSIPSVLKLWIDQIVRGGKTFAVVDGNPKGLLQGKKVTFVVASGWAYDAGTALASYNFVEPYLRTMFGFLGITDIAFHNASGTSALMYGKIDRQTFLQPHIESIRNSFQTTAA